MPPVGGVGGMDAIGAMLARRQPPPAAGQPPGNGGAPPSGTDPGMAAGMGAAGADAQTQQMMAGMSQIQQIGEQCKQVAATFPLTADTMQQIQQLLKQAVVQMAPQAPTQTPSSAAVPGAGGPMA